MLLIVKILTCQCDVMFGGMEEEGLGDGSISGHSKQTMITNEWSGDQISGHLPSLEVITHD